MKQKLFISILLLVSMVLLTILVPGGPIESRDFSHISPVILGSFNTFLTSLGLLSLFLIYFVMGPRRWASLFAFICGLSYFIVYVLDLGAIFPISPTPMPMTLKTIEIIGALLAIPLMVLSIRDYRNTHNLQSSEKLSKSFLYAILVMIIIGIGIIIFATNAAMHNS